MQKLTKRIFTVVLACFLVVEALSFSMPALAAVDAWGNDTLKDKVGSETGLGNKDPREIVAGVIKVVLGFLGIVAVVIILIGGFKWMTAAGNEDKVDEAKKLITAGVIGLIIILSAYGIATFVINGLLNATTSS